MPEAAATTSKLDLTLWMAESPSGLLGSFEYSTDLFDEATIERMASHLRALEERAEASEVTVNFLLPTYLDSSPFVVAALRATLTITSLQHGLPHARSMYCIASKKHDPEMTSRVRQ